MAKSIYKSEKGRDTMAAWYERHLEKLGCESLESIEVDTRYGRTNILVGGPVDAPPLWCFHGAMSTAPAALAQVPSLLQRFRIYFPDTIGSLAAAMNDVSTGREKSTVTGVSISSTRWRSRPSVPLG